MPTWTEIAAPVLDYVAAQADRVAHSMADFVLHPNGRLFWVNVLVALAILVLVYALRPDWRAQWGQRGVLAFLFPGRNYRHASTLTDIKLMFANIILVPMVNIFARFNGAYFASLVTAGIVAVLGPPAQPLEWTFPVVLGFSILLVLADDLGYWVWHALAHRVPALWAFHAVHHSAEVMTPLVANREHPVEVMLVPVFRAAAVGLIAGLAAYFIAGETMILAIFGINIFWTLLLTPAQQLIHAHVPISWGRLDHIFHSPALHHLHHSADPAHQGKNMGGLLAVWDWMFGTLLLPVRGQALRYGIAGTVAQPHDGFAAAWLRPFAELLPASMRRRLQR